MGARSGCPECAPSASPQWMPGVCPERVRRVRANFAPPTVPPPRPYTDQGLFCATEPEFAVPGGSHARPNSQCQMIKRPAAPNQRPQRPRTSQRRSSAPSAQHTPHQEGADQAIRANPPTARHSEASESASTKPHRGRPLNGPARFRSTPEVGWPAPVGRPNTRTNEESESAEEESGGYGSSDGAMLRQWRTDVE